MKIKKILHIAPAYQALGGGIFEVVENLTDTQDNMESLSVDIICPSNISLSETKKTIFPILPNNLFQISSILQTLIFLWKRRNKYFAVHIHGAWSLQLLFVSPFLKFFSGRIIYQPHGLLSPVALKKSWLIKKIAWFLYQKSYIKNSDAIISCSDKENSELLAINFNHDKLNVIPNGLEKIFYGPSININKREDKLLFLSQITPIKNLEALFNAIAAIKSVDNNNIFLDIFGYGPDKYVESLKKLANTINISQNISFKGIAERNKRVQIYDNYKYFVLPSLSENFGISVLEALSRKCIVITSKETPWRDYTHPLLHIVDTDASSISNSLKSLLDGPRVYNHVSGDLKEFSWELITKKILAVYLNEEFSNAL